MTLTTERKLFYLFCVLAASPLLFSHYPPMIDLPQHAAQISTLNRLNSPDFLYGGLYQLNWFTPYLGGYLIVWCFSQFMPVLLAFKTVIAAIIIAIPVTASRMRAHFKGDPAWDWLMLPIGYGFAFQWGLFNFWVGVPFVLVFMLYVFKYADDPKPITGCWLTVFALALYVIHLLILIFGCGLALLYIITSKTIDRKGKVIASIPFVIPIFLGVIYQVIRMSDGGQVSEEGPWNLSIFRPLEFLVSPTGVLPLTLSNIGIGLLIFTLPFLLGARFTDHKPRLIIFGALLIWMMLGPNYIFGNYFTYNRFAIFGLPFFLLALTPTTKTIRHFHLLRSLFYILPAAIILTTCLRFATFDTESRGYRDIAQNMQANKRTLTLAFNNKSSAFGLPMFLHFPSWYQAESTGIVDFSFSKFLMPLSYKQDAGVTIERSFEWFPQRFNWTKHQGWLYDYFVVRHEKNLGPFLFQQTDCPVRLIAHSGLWWLYETQTGGSGNPNACDSKRQMNQSLQHLGL